MVDITIDTNVILHAENPNESRFAAAISFFALLQTSDVIWCLDEGFDASEARNRSRIYSEYLARALPSALGMQVLAFLAANERIVSRPAPSPTVRKTIRQLVWDPTDRVFAHVAKQSESGVLVTHDLANFPTQCCKGLEDLGVAVVDANRAVDMLG